MNLCSDRLIDKVERTRERTNGSLNDRTRAALGQFMTPAVVGSLMASMFRKPDQEIRLLDAGAGVGSLTAAFLREAISRSPRPKLIHATAYELDPVMLSGLREVFDTCEFEARRSDVRFIGEIVEGDFIEEASKLLVHNLFRNGAAPRFNAAILNPPYRKIGSQSKERDLLRSVGIETSNLYTGFVGLAIQLLEPEGELVAITPRSFCNGSYFRPFRKLLLEEMSLLRVHVFESRNRAFKDDAVLQENIIFHAKKNSLRETVTLSTSAAPGRHPGPPVGLPRHYQGACPALEPAGSRNRRLRRAVATTHPTRLSRAPCQARRRIRGRLLAPGRCRGQSRATPFRSELCRSVRREPTRRFLWTAASTSAQSRRQSQRQSCPVGRRDDPTTGRHQDPGVLRSTNTGRPDTSRNTPVFETLHRTGALPDSPPCFERRSHLT